MNSSNYTWNNILSKRKAILLSMTVDGIMDTDGYLTKEYLKSKNMIDSYHRFNAVNFLSHEMSRYRTQKEKTLLHSYMKIFLPGITKVNIIKAIKQFQDEIEAKRQYKAKISEKSFNRNVAIANMLEHIEDCSDSFLACGKHSRVIKHFSFYLNWLRNKLLNPDFAEKFVRKYVLVTHVPSNLYYYTTSKVKRIKKIMEKHGIILLAKDLKPLENLMKLRPLGHNTFQRLLYKKIEKFGPSRVNGFFLMLRKNRLYVVISVD